MATGDAAAAAGLYVVPATKDKRLGYDDINRRGDELAAHMKNAHAHTFSQIDGTLLAAQITALAVGTAAIADGAVTAVKLANTAVETAKIKDLAVTTAKLNAQAVTAAKIANATITVTQLANNAVETAKIKDGAVTNAKINANAVTADKLAATLSRTGTWTIEADTLVLRDGTNTDKLTLGGGFDLRTNQAGVVKADGTLDLDSGGETTITSDQQVYIRSTFSTQIDADTSVSVTAADNITLDAGGTVNIEGKTGELHVGGDDEGGRVWSPTVYSRTYSASANVVVTSAGTLGRSTSSRRYKTDIADARPMPEVLDIVPRVWADINDPARLPQFGAIAEELDDLGLAELVVYVDDQPEAIAYDRIVIALIPVVRDLATRLANIEAALPASTTPTTED